jgi:ABC-type Fe3+-hydroxamate transport system substrate-binding protein
VKDQLNRTIKLVGTPKRIVSLVPSQTELLYHLGLDEEIVGITKFCVHPNHWFEAKQKVGGTKSIHISQVERLAPDLIIANKEENTKEDIERMQAFCPVWVSDVSSFDDALNMIEGLGLLLNRMAQASQLLGQIRNAKQQFELATLQKTPALYFIWKSPYMVAGCDTFINDMMKLAGFENVVHQNRYPILELSEIQKLSPKLILLSSEPFPFKQNDVLALSQQLPDTKVILVDGELFSWYGSRMLQSFDYFSALHEQIQ